MMHPKELKISDYTYILPEEKIAKFPLTERDASKLLLYKDGKMSEHPFKNIIDFIPKDSLILFNNTRVINARIIFYKSTGAAIEIFCLEPEGNYVSGNHECIWTCLIGNKKKWQGEILEKKDHNGNTLQAEFIGGEQEYFKVKFTWTGNITFWEILENMGQLPIPPYLNRKTEEKDFETYQTVYAKHNGSVAAPTAGLHFTPEILQLLASKNIYTDELTLHVGAGTFKPVKSETMSEHAMHAEYIQITQINLDNILKFTNRFCVGTTSLRTLETLYWAGVKVLKNVPLQEVWVSQWDAYEIESDYTYEEAISALKIYMGTQDSISGKTEILIAPGYQIRSIKGLITNFHQPQSTLLLLVAAIVGDDWRNIYNYALNHQFRFLSYGDSSLLFAEK